MSVWATVQQPYLFPPIYMIERFARCDHVVWMDRAKFDRDNTQVRLSGPNGFYMQSLPLQHAPFSSRFDQRRVLEPARWARRFVASLQTSYGRSEHFKALKPWLLDLLDRMAAWDDLVHFATTSTHAVAALLQLDCRFHRGSSFFGDSPGDPTTWLVDLVRPFGCTDYIQGERSMRNYFIRGPFEDARIRTWGQRFDIDYPCLSGRQGDAGLSILDLLLSLGVEHTRALLHIEGGACWQGNAVEITR